jgi:hypothetical protein
MWIIRADQNCGTEKAEEALCGNSRHLRSGVRCICIKTRQDEGLDTDLYVERLKVSKDDSLLGRGKSA